MGNQSKQLCMKCKYHGFLGHTGAGQQDIVCLRILVKREACVDKDGVDRRGDDPESCKLFMPGKRIRGKLCTPESWKYEKFYYQ